MAHQVTDSGFPVDPELARLEDHLGTLAARWRAAQGHLQRQGAIVQEYHETLSQLSQRGWDAEAANLEHESTLPDEFMPTGYGGYHSERTSIEADVVTP